MRESDLDRALEAAERLCPMAQRCPPMTGPKSCARRPICSGARADTIRLPDPGTRQAAAEAKGEVLAVADVIDWFARSTPRLWPRHPRTR